MKLEQKNKIVALQQNFYNVVFWCFIDMTNNFIKYEKV